MNKLARPAALVPGSLLLLALRTFGQFETPLSAIVPDRYRFSRMGGTAERRYGF